MLGHDPHRVPAYFTGKLQSESLLRTSKDLKFSVQTITMKIISGNDPHPLRTITLPASIGRAVEHGTRPGSQNGLFHNPFLSRHHAVLRLENDRLIIEDLGSSNGTFVNGVAVKSGEVWPVANGDLIQFGSEDEKDNAAIVAQIFYENGIQGHNEIKRNSYNSNNSNSSNFSSGIRPESDLMTLADGGFSAPRLERFNISEAKGSFPSNFPISMKSKDDLCVEKVATKIADVTRALASYGIKARTRSITGSGKHSLPGAIQVLESIEQLVAKLNEDDEMLADNHEVNNLQNLTIHQQPNLTIAMSIINSYEMFFCLMMACLAFWIIWQGL